MTIIRARTIAIAATLVLSTALAGCGTTTPTGSVAPSPGPSTAVASPTTAASGSPAPAEPTATPAEPTATPTRAPTGGPTMVVRAYFLLADPAGGPRTLVPVLREEPKSSAVAHAAMTALLAGPTRAQRRADPAISTLIPSGTTLLGLDVDDGTATVDLSARFTASGSRRALTGRLAQVVYTLTQFGRIDRVRLRVDGDAVAGLGGRWTRADFRDGWLSDIWVDRPAWGAAVGNPARVGGLADVFEAQFRMAVLDRDGDVLAERAVRASCGTGCWGRFDTTLRYDVSSGRWGTLRVWDPSERDGRPESVREYPVWLSPD